jgi:hypothetical protein
MTTSFIIEAFDYSTLVEPDVSSSTLNTAAIKRVRRSFMNDDERREARRAYARQRARSLASGQTDVSEDGGKRAHMRHRRQ